MITTISSIDSINPAAASSLGLLNNPIIENINPRHKKRIFNLDHQQKIKHKMAHTNPIEPITFFFTKTS